MNAVIASELRPGRGEIAGCAVLTQTTAKTGTATSSNDTPDRAAIDHEHEGGVS
jgi:hypothetical protein